MRVPAAIVIWLWTAFFVFWLVPAQFNKKPSGGVDRPEEDC